jgi:hypothetical protein
VKYSSPDDNSSSNFAPSGDAYATNNNGGYNDNSNGGYADNAPAANNGSDNNGDFASRGYSLAPDMPLGDSQAQAVPAPQASAPAPVPQQQALTPYSTNKNTGNVAYSTPSVLIYLKDGSTFVAADYWLKGGVLHYNVNYGGLGTVNMDEVDLQRTVDENARRGVRFSLKPDPDPSNTNPNGSYEQNSNPAPSSTAPAPAVSGTSQT